MALHLMWLMDPGMLQLTMLDQSSDPVVSNGATLDVANGLQLTMLLNRSGLVMALHLMW